VPLKLVLMLPGVRFSGRGPTSFVGATSSSFLPTCLSHSPAACVYTLNSVAASCKLIAPNKWTHNCTMNDEDKSKLLASNKWTRNGPVKHERTG
jgi:hypothetical protein